MKKYFYLVGTLFGLLLSAYWIVQLSSSDPQIVVHEGDSPDIERLEAELSRMHFLNAKLEKRIEEFESIEPVSETQRESKKLQVEPQDYLDGLAPTPGLSPSSKIDETGAPVPETQVAAKRFADDTERLLGKDRMHNFLSNQAANWASQRQYGEKSSRIPVAALDPDTLAPKVNEELYQRRNEEMNIAHDVYQVSALRQLENELYLECLRMAKEPDALDRLDELANQVHELEEALSLQIDGLGLSYKQIETYLKYGGLWPQRH